MSVRRSMTVSDMSFSNITAAFVAVLVGITSSAAIVFQAANTVGATPEQTSSWIAACCIGMFATCVGLSLYYRVPVLTAWSTPGAVVLITSLSGSTIHEAIGVFLFSAACITLSGVTGWFERVMDKIPVPIASAMLAGVLLQFCLNVFVSMKSQFSLVAAMFAAYLIFKILLPRYAILIVLAIGILCSYFFDLTHFDAINVGLTVPTWITPSFSWSSIIGAGIPLFIVTMASQNAPGVAALRAFGYKVPISPLMTWTGLTTLVLAPFGAFSVNLAAVTAAICMGDEADPDPKKRYMAAVIAGFFYLIVGLLGATVVSLFSAFPKDLIAAIAGLALFSTIANALTSAMADATKREPALITFLVTASGISLYGIGAAFWGLVIGLLSLGLMHALRKG